MTDQSDPNASLARLLRLAEQRGLAGVEMTTATNGPALHVADTAFVQVADAATAMLHCPADQKVLLMEISPDLYFETDDLVGRDIMLIRLDRISDEELSLRLHDAWMFKAPERLKKA